MYLDAQRGWLSQASELLATKNRNIAELGFSEEEALAVVMTHAHEARDGENLDLHSSTVRATLARIGVGGSNHAFLSNMCAVSMYEFWETQGRAQLAEAFFGNQDFVQSDLFGDLRNIRHCILHCKAVADSRVAKSKILRWFQDGERIAFNGPRLHVIVQHTRGLSQGLTHLARTNTFGPAPGGVFIEHLGADGNPICPGSLLLR